MIRIQARQKPNSEKNPGPSKNLSPQKVRSHNNSRSHKQNSIRDGPKKGLTQNHLNSKVSSQAGLAGEVDSAEKLGSSLLCLKNWKVDKLFEKFTPVFWKLDCCVLCPMCGPELLPGKASQLNLWSGRSDLWHRLIKTLAMTGYWSLMILYMINDHAIMKISTNPTWAPPRRSPLLRESQTQFFSLHDHARSSSDRELVCKQTLICVASVWLLLLDVSGKGSKISNI